MRIEAGGTLTMAGGRINNTQAVYGNAIYVDEAANKVGTVMLQNKPQIDGSIYLVGNKTVVNADKSYLPASGVNIALQHDYSGREVAVMTDGTKMDSEHQKLFGLTDSIRALYEVKPKEDAVLDCEALRAASGNPNPLPATAVFTILEPETNKPKGSIEAGVTITLQIKSLADKVDEK